MRFAILEDSRSQALLLKTMAEKLGHQALVFSSAREFREALADGQFDLLLMDWVLPDGSGDELLAWIRQTFGWRLPIIFATARAEEEDVAAMLRLGADDYVCKPIRYVELAARIEALMRRLSVERERVEVDDAPLVVGNIEVSPASRSIRVDGEIVPLTAKEFDLALLMLRNLGTLFNRQTLLDRIWGLDASLDTRTVDTHVSRIRRKLSLEEANGWQLTSVYGHGYRLERLAREVETR